MTRFLITTVLFAPSAILIFLSLQPQVDASASLPLFHFYIVTFTTFSAAVISILLSTTLQGIAEPRHVLAAVAFAVIGIIFFLHGFATRGALINYAHPAVRWSAWLTLFGGGAVFALAGLDNPGSWPKWLPMRRIVYIIAGAIGLYVAMATLAQQWLVIIDNYGIPLQPVIFLTSLGLWLLATFRFWQIWRVSRSRVDGMLAFLAFWLANAVVSMHQFPVWQLSWWLYHFILLVSFLFTVYVLTTEYEQARQFRLLPYYLAASLIFTALLALVASYLFAEFSYRTLVTQIKSSSVSLVNSLTQEIANNLPDGVTPEAGRAIYAARLATLPVGEITLYDPVGMVFYPADSNKTGSVSPEERVNFERALAGETLVEVYPPTALRDNPFGPIYTVQTYAPLPAARVNAEGTASPLGVLVTWQGLPELNQAILQARITGLFISALTMGLLFVALLLIVGRADRIIATGTAELLQAYTSLRQVESMRDDLNHMIIHDLRNPLNIISATFDLLHQTTGEARAKALDRFLGSAYAATRRMTGMINDILTVGKLEAGQLNPQFALILLADLLADRLSNFMPQAAAEGKQLTLDCPFDLTVQLDPDLIGRVIENLVSNAFKYTRANGIIHVSVQTENGCVRMTVRDNGEGIPDDYKQHIFEKFAQVPNANGASMRKGTGLGLTFCGLAVRAHGGQIWVADAPGGGSDFIFILPQKHPSINQ